MPFPPPPPTTPWQHYLRPFLPSRRTALLSLTLLAALALASPFAYRAYQKLRARQLTHQGQAALRARDLRSAILALREAALRDPDYPPPARLLRDLAAQLNAPETVDWAQRLSDIEPTFENLSACFRLALQHQRLDAAGLALDTAATHHAENPYYHSMRAAWLTAGGDLAAAEASLQKAIRLSDSPEFRLNLASLRLKLPDPQHREQALRELESIGPTDPGCSTARRELLNYYSSHQDRTNATRCAAALWEAGESDPATRLDLYRVLLQAGHPLAGDIAAALSVAASADPALAAAWIARLTELGHAADAIEWWRKQPPQLRRDPRPALPLIDALRLAPPPANDTPLWQDLARNVDWAGIDSIPLLLQDLFGGQPAGPSIWESWARSHSKNTPLLRQTAALALRWNLPSPAEASLWQLTGNPANGIEPLRDLFSLYHARKDSPNLYRAALLAHTRNPDDPLLANNRAALGLLTGRDTALCHRLAETNWKQHPDSPPAATTRALSLLLQDRAPEGLQLIETLPPAALARHEVAFHRALLLAACGRIDAARASLPPDALTTLLPEELALWARFNKSP